MSQKIVINKRFGGFGLSKAAMIRLRELGSEAALKEPIEPGEKYYDGSVFDPGLRILTASFSPDIDRDDPLLIQVVEEMGDAADGDYATLAIIEIPDDVEWEIDEYDGKEHIAEKHRTWD